MGLGSDRGATWAGMGGDGKGWDGVLFILAVWARKAPIEAPELDASTTSKTMSKLLTLPRTHKSSFRQQTHLV